MREIYCTYDVTHGTWNIMENTSCIFYGSVLELEEFLIENKDKYYEQQPN
jgi:hypothetical protein